MPCGMFSSGRVFSGSKSRCMSPLLAVWHHNLNHTFSFSMKGWDPEGNLGPRKPLPDSVQIHEPPLDKIVSEPSSEQREPIIVPTALPVQEEPAFQQDGYQQEAYAAPVY